MPSEREMESIAGAISFYFSKSNQCANYAIEAFTLLVQFDLLLPQRLAGQLAWSGTVNTHGRPGKNIPCDLHMEHLNREVKNQIAGLGSNITDASVKRVGNALSQVLPVLQQFDQINRIKAQSSRRTCEKDMAILLKQLHEKSVLHLDVPTKLKGFQPNSMKSLQRHHLVQWMEEQLRKLKTYHC